MRRLICAVAFAVGGVLLGACGPGPVLPHLPANPTYGQMARYCWAAFQSVNSGVGGNSPEAIYRDCMGAASKLARR